ATLAALIGAGGLGNVFFFGIDSNDAAMTLMGALAAAVFAVVFSLLVSYWLVPGRLNEVICLLVVVAGTF
ncbi:glycine/betaine ABC transporter permease, partial [Lacticaseibacillus rhamnosus]